jgi:hypothetical protein
LPHSLGKLGYVFSIVLLVFCKDMYDLEFLRGWTGVCYGFHHDKVSRCLCFSFIFYDVNLIMDTGPVHICIFACHCASGGAIFFPFDSDSKGVFIIALPPLLPCFFYVKCNLWNTLLLQGITTYEYVVAMRTQSEPPGPSVDGGEQQSLPTSPTSSAVTTVSGRSSIGMSLQYKGSWCTPPRIFMDHQVPHLSESRYQEKLVSPMLEIRVV